MIRKLQHVGISVRDLDQSISFYRDVIGLNLIVHKAFEDAKLSRMLSLEGARGRVAYLEKNGVAVELFEFASPHPQPSPPDRPVCDHGITHLSIEVEDLDSLYRRWSDAGMRFHCPPLVFFGTTKATYGRDPDGNVIELIEML